MITDTKTFTTKTYNKLI